MAPFIRITEDALSHFGSLIAREEIPGMALRIFVEQPGTPMADISISFCPPGEYRAGDLPLQYPDFTLYVDKASRSYLEEAEIDYKKEGLSGQLAIRAPHLQGKPEEDAPLSDRVNHILQAEINPQLASHGGMVTLVEITPEQAVILRFGGGCHGCGMVDVTLKQGIEKTLIERFPNEIKAVLDVTDHSQGENPYY